MVRRVAARQASRGKAGLGVAWLVKAGEVCPGIAGQGMALHGRQAGLGKARRVAACHV